MGVAAALVAHDERQHHERAEGDERDQQLLERVQRAHVLGDHEVGGQRGQAPMYG